MGLLIACAKGCGEAIEVTEEMVEEAKKNNRPMWVEHDVCPNAPESPMRHYRVQFKVFELKPDGVDRCDKCDMLVDEEGRHLDPGVDKDHAPVIVQAMKEEELCSIGDTVEAKTFRSAIEPIGRELNKQWARVIGMADIVDQPSAEEDESTTEPA